MAVLVKELRELSHERREAIAMELVARMSRAACGGLGTWWSEIERIHAAMNDSAMARDVADPAMALCANCPVAVECDRLARVNHYTGLAAGMAWKNGRSRGVGRVTERRRKEPTAA